MFEPSTGAQVTRTFEADKDIVDLAVSGARLALTSGPWSRMRPLDRQALILKLADVIEAASEELAFLESVDVGKPWTLARTVDVGGAVDILRYFAGWATKIDGRAAPLSAYDASHFGLTLKQPVGVVAAIAPWNFPTQTLIWKCAAAFAAGCVVVAKPSEVTPIATLRLAELITEAGFPPGVFNVVNGTGAITGAALVGHPGINKVSFTGSTSSGRRVGQMALDNMARLTLELGGKSPAIVCADADIDVAVAGVVNGIFFNSGQVCDAGSRVIVDERIHDEFLHKLVLAASTLAMGPGLDPDVFMGTLASSQHLAKVRGYVHAARDSGLSFALDRSNERSEGCFVGPTIIRDCPSDHPVWQEEIFGPVLAVQQASGLEALLAAASESDYGLGASIYSKDMATILTLARKLDAGTIFVNGHGFLDPSFPFGGLRNSGFGKDLGPEQMDSFLSTKSLLFTGLGAA